MFRPLLAPLNSPADTPTFFDDIVFPQLVSPKVDGIRALVRREVKEDFFSLNLSQQSHSENVVLSRNMEKFRSKQVQAWYSSLLHADGELAYNPTAADCLHVTQSHVRSSDKFCDTLGYYVFDYCDEAVKDLEYYRRLELLEKMIRESGVDNVLILPQENVDSVDELLVVEARYLAEGYEGVMFRNPLAPYKHNRATYLENIIYKLKRFKDAEAVIVDIEEGSNNNNVQIVDARGFAKRSTNKDNMSPNGMVKHFICRRLSGDDTETLFKVMPGILTHLERRYILEHKEEFIEKILTFRYFEYGMKNDYRFARFRGFREKWDMS